MIRFLATFLSICFLQVSFGQIDESFIDGQGFNSIFQNYETGEFEEALME